MTFLKRIKNYKTSRMRQEEVLTKGWFIFRWEILLVVALGIIAALLNQIPNWVIKHAADGSVDPIFGYPLRDNIVYSSISIFTTIGIAIFIGVFSEIGKFAGKYGSAIFVIVPSFVWLLSDRSDNHIEHVLETAKTLGTIIFWVMIAVGILFTFITIVKQFMAAYSLADRTKLKVEFIYNFISRFLVVLINIMIVLMLGYGLVNYGIFSLHLADNAPDIVAKTNIPYDLHSENFTIFIAIIAVVFALIMVLIGLATTFVSKEETDIEKEREEEWETKTISVEALENLEHSREEREVKKERGY